MPTDTRPQRKGAPAAVARALALALPVALSVAACSSSPQSFVVLDLEHDPTETSVTAIADITTVEVDVSGGTPQAGTTPMRTLDYDARVLDGGSLTIQNPPALGTLSVSFSGGERGSVTFSVSLVDGQSCVVGQGTASTVLRPGGIVELVVFIRTAHNCNQDGGTPDGGEGGVTFPGCDTVDPTAGAPMCSTNPVQTCVVNCAMHKTECALGGAGPPGALCKSNVDCQPGTQCFDYTGLGPGCTGVKVCLRFCASAATCAAVGDGGAGPGSVCEGRVPCGGVDTSYHTCTFNCDPSASAAGARGGCPTGLACVLFGSGDQVDCTCPAATQTKQEGQPCTSGADCAPGLLCNAMGGTMVCRSICRCDASGGACSLNSSSCPTPGTHCVPVTNNTLFGICL
jgi:hypothetical protein